jgi:hypothetical protein
MIKHPLSSEDVPPDINFDRYFCDYRSEIDFFNSDKNDVKEIYPIINNKVVHRCSKKSFCSIITDGFISPNLGQYEYTYPQSKINLGIIEGWICLFDFTALPHHICEQYNTWSPFLLQFKEQTILFVIDKNKIDFTENPFYCQDEIKAFCIPYVEIWSRKPIPLCLIEKTIIVRHEKKNKFFVLNDIEEVIEKINC